MLRYVGLAALLVLAPAAQADTYKVPDDAKLTSLDLDTGAVLWQADPGPTSVWSQLWLIGSGPRAAIAIVPGVNGSRTISAAVRRSGKVLSKRQVRKLAKKKRKPSLRIINGTDYVDHKGRKIAFSSGNTRHIEAIHGGSTKQLVRLDTYPQEMTVADELVIFTYSAGTDGGEVIAYDLEKDQVRWKFDAWREDSSIGQDAFTALSADDKKVYVSVAQIIFALEIETGKMLWKRSLPKQVIRRYDAPWTTFGKIGNKLILRVYEDLFAIESDTGKLTWSFDAGRFAQPWPVIGDELFLLTRDGPVSPSSMSFVGRRKTKASAIKVSRRGDTVTMKTMSTRDIPKNASSWYSLAMPPAKPKADKSIALTLKDKGETWTFDLSGPLSKRRSTTYVSFHGFHDAAKLTVDGKEVASATF